MTDSMSSEWLTDRALQRCWAQVLARFEKAGLEAVGRVKVATPDRASRRAVGDLLGKTVTGTAVQIDLAVLDARLRKRSGVGGLAAVLTMLNGQPPHSRPAERDVASQARERPLLAAASLGDTPGIGPWVADWVAELRRSGLLTNRPHAEDAVHQAAAVLAKLTIAAGERPPCSRVELAAQVLGDAHGLDVDRLVQQLVTRGLAAASGRHPPSGSREREALWRLYRVEPDLISRTCLAWKIGAIGTSATASRINEAAKAGDPIHLTEWDLRKIESCVGTVRHVLVCENPRVLEAIAERQVPEWAVVSISGEPNLVTDRVLTMLASTDSDLYYHGDFDWPGIGIANRLIERTGARPWHYGARDYIENVRSDAPQLMGPPVAPSWDHELGAAMRTRGRALHEESVLPALVDSLVLGLAGSDSQE